VRGEDTSGRSKAPVRTELEPTSSSASHATRSHKGGSHLLLAVGRRPNTDDLGLERLASLSTPAATSVDDQLRTSVPGIWAWRLQRARRLTHTSYNDFEIVAANLLDSDPRRVSDRHYCLQPVYRPAARRAGMTETEVRASGGPRDCQAANEKVAAPSRKRDPRLHENLVDRDTGFILGASLLGMGGDEVIHSLLDL